MLRNPSSGGSRRAEAEAPVTMSMQANPTSNCTCRYTEALQYMREAMQLLRLCPRLEAARKTTLMAEVARVAVTARAAAQ